MDRSVARSVDAVVLVGAFPGHWRGYVLDGTGAGVVSSEPTPSSCSWWC